MTIIQKPSPNHDGNRKPIDRIVIHWIVGSLAMADGIFAKPNSTSSHYGVENDQVHQYVQENKVAYHAGNYLMNQRSIGIEHSAAPDRPASDSTYKTSGELIAQIAKRHNIPLDRAHILRHSEVIETKCCGTVDVDRLIQIAKGNITSSPNNMERKKAMQVDRILNYFKNEGFIDNASSEAYFDNPQDEDELLNLVKRIVRDLKASTLNEQNIRSDQSKKTTAEIRAKIEALISAL